MKPALVAFVSLLFLQRAGVLADDGSAFRVSVYTGADTPAESIAYEEIDGLVLAFINPADDCGGFAATDFPGIRQIVRGAQQERATGHPIAVTFAIGGGGDEALNERLEAIAASSNCRKQFAGQIAEILTENGLDGVEMDWEFPDSSSLGNYTLLLQAIRQAIGTKTLSITLYDDGGKEDPSRHMTKDVYPYVDYYMIMGYLEPRNDALDTWINPPWSIPPAKLRLGLAFFGIPDDDDAPSLAYNAILGTVPPAQASPCGDRVGIYTINGLRTTGELTRFAMTEELGGITGWELGQDRTDSISLLSTASGTSRMWEQFAQWQAGTSYPAGTIVQDDGNLWLARSANPQGEPGLANTAFKQIEMTAQWSDLSYYCGGDAVWFSGAVYRAVQDPTLNVTNLSPAAAASLWKKLYSAPAYDNATTYKKGNRVYFDGAVYTATRTTSGRSPKVAANWTPYVDANAYESTKSYSAGTTVRYMGNQYRSRKSSEGMNPVVATDVWDPVTQ